MKVNMLEVKRFRWFHRLLQWILGMTGFVLAARAFCMIMEAPVLYVNKRNWTLALLPLVFGVGAAAYLGWLYRVLFPDGVPENDTTDIISPFHFNRAARQLVFAFLKGMGWLALALFGIWIGSLMA